MCADKAITNAVINTAIVTALTDVSSNTPSTKPVEIHDTSREHNQSSVSKTLQRVSEEPHY